MPHLILVGLFLALFLRIRSAGEPKRRAVVSKPYASCGPDGIQLQSYDEWFKVAPAIVLAARNEGVDDPAEVVNNTMRRLFPTETWPPELGDSRFAQWQLMVEAVARTMGVPFKKQLHVVG